MTKHSFVRRIFGGSWGRIFISVFLSSITNNNFVPKNKFVEKFLVYKNISKYTCYSEVIEPRISNSFSALVFPVEKSIWNKFQYPANSQSNCAQKPYPTRFLEPTGYHIITIVDRQDSWMARGIKEWHAKSLDCVHIRVHTLEGTKTKKESLEIGVRCCFTILKNYYTLHLKCVTGKEQQRQVQVYGVA